MSTSIHVIIIFLLLLNSIITVTPDCIASCKARYKKSRKLSNCIHNICAYKKRGFQSLSDRFITDSTMQSNPDNNCILDSMWNDLSKSSQEFILKVFDSEVNFDKLSKK